MSEPKVVRYTAVGNWDGHAEFNEDEIGGWVRYSDYGRLEAKVEELERAAQESWTAVQFLLHEDDPKTCRRTLGELKVILKAALKEKP